MEKVIKVALCSDTIPQKYSAKKSKKSKNNVFFFQIGLPQILSEKGDNLLIINAPQ